MATPPATPAGLTCRRVSGSEIDISWDASSGATGYHVYRCTGTSCIPTALVHKESATSWSDIGLTSNTTYRYRLTAYNEAGESAYSWVVSCGPMATRPTAPAGLTCQWVSGSEIDISLDASSGATGYHVYRCTGVNCTPTTQVHTESTICWSDTGLTSNTAYCYRLTAYNEAGESGYSSIVSCTTYNPEVAWNKTFGGSGIDWAYSVQQTSDGGYIVAGDTGSYGAGDFDVWLIKTDPSGNVTWNKTFGGSGNDGAYSVQQTSDGGYIVAGTTASYIYARNSGDVWLIKTDSSGNMAWNKTFDGSGNDWAYSVQQTSDGGYIVTGYTYSYEADDADVLLIKADSSGNMAWNKTFGGSDYEYGRSVQQTLDGGYIITGEISSYGAGMTDVWLIKVTA
jgi:hypothetical protein